jgi:hypothetical protein
MAPNTVSATPITTSDMASLCPCTSSVYKRQPTRTDPPRRLRKRTRSNADYKCTPRALRGPGGPSPQAGSSRRAHIGAGDEPLRDLAIRWELEVQLQAAFATLEVGVCLHFGRYAPLGKGRHHVGGIQAQRPLPPMWYAGNISVGGHQGLNALGRSEGREAYAA